MSIGSSLLCCRNTAYFSDRFVKINRFDETVGHMRIASVIFWWSSRVRSRTDEIVSDGKSFLSYPCEDQVRLRLGRSRYPVLDDSYARERREHPEWSLNHRREYSWSSHRRCRFERVVSMDAGNATRSNHPDRHWSKSILSSDWLGWLSNDQWPRGRRLNRKWNQSVRSVLPIHLGWVRSFYPWIRYRWMPNHNHP